MADIAPLCPLRYTTADLASVVAPPYDVIDDAERAALLARSPHNVVRLILPEGSADEKHGHAARLLAEWRESGILARDDVPSFYRYRQTFTPPLGGARRTRSGFLALVRATAFGEGAVLPHERTLAGPRADRLKLFRATRANLSPGLMLYRDPGRVLEGAFEQTTPLSAFTTDDGIVHQLDRVCDRAAITSIVEHVRGQSLLIADGHHRYETAVRYAAEVDATSGALADPALAPEYRYFMALLCSADDDALLICATHRLVHSLPNFAWRPFLAAAERDFMVTPLHGSVRQWTAALADQRGVSTSFVAVGRPLDGVTAPAVLLTLRAEIDVARHPALSSRPPAVRRAGVAVLHALLLEAVLGVTAQQQEEKTRVTYLQDPALGVAALDRGEGQILFLMNPTDVGVVRDVAEAGEVMPQKSTYFYPKVPTGLAIHTLEPERSVPT